MTAGGRSEVAAVMRRHGAYLVSWLGDLTDDATPDELFDAASSLVVAKRLAREGAEAFGYTLAGWETDEHGTHWLFGTYTPTKVTR